MLAAGIQLFACGVLAPLVLPPAIRLLFRALAYTLSATSDSTGTA
jgi:hypothetical protein